LHWATIDMPRGSYCWNSGAGAKCRDSAGAYQPLKTGHLKPYWTAGGFEVGVTFHSASQPKAFKVKLIQSPDGKAGPVAESAAHSFGIGMSPPAAVGLCVYLVTATWTEGDVSFYLTLQLLPGGA
jgi:hypothetical protein